MRINRKLYKDYYNGLEFLKWALQKYDNFSWTPAETWERIYMDEISPNKLENWHRATYDVYRDDFEEFHQAVTEFCLMKKNEQAS